MADLDPVAPRDDPTRPSPAGPRRWMGAAVAGLVIVLLAVVAVLQWQRAQDLAAEDEELAAAALAAGTFVTELLGYDHRDLDAHEQAVISRATDRFVTEYQRALDGGLRDNIVALEAIATATVRDVFLGAPAGDRIEAVVIVDTEVTSRTGTRRLVGAYLQVALERDRANRTWLVDEVTSVATLDEVLVPPEGGAGEAPTATPTSPSTPAPSPTSTPSPTEGPSPSP